jgi:hypothetical protein
MNYNYSSYSSSINTFNSMKPWAQWFIIRKMKFLLYVLAALLVPFSFLTNLPRYFMTVKEDIDDTFEHIYSAKAPE